MTPDLKRMRRQFLCAYPFIYAAMAGGFYWYDGDAWKAIIIPAVAILPGHYMMFGGVEREHDPDTDVVCKVTAKVVRRIGNYFDREGGRVNRPNTLHIQRRDYGYVVALEWQQSVPYAKKGWIGAIFTWCLLILFGVKLFESYPLLTLWVGMITLGIMGAIWRNFGLSWVISRQKRGPSEYLVLPASALADWYDEGAEPRFIWGARSPNGDKVQHIMPLAAVTEFELGTYNQYFAPINAKLAHDYYVVVLKTPEGLQQVAAHAGSESEMQHLIAQLTQEFITNRAIFLERAKAAVRHESSERFS